MGYLLAFFVLSLLIVVHELGHLIVAKIFDVKATRFSIFFGPVLWSKKIGETEYAISSIPLGGYVQMKGEDNPNEPDPRAFSRKPIWQRMLIILAGPVTNLVFAFICMVAFFGAEGVPRITSVVGKVTEGSPAERVGIQSGDRITHVCEGGFKKCVAIEDFSAVQSALNTGEHTHYLIVTRGGATMYVAVKPELGEVKNIFDEAEKRYIIGIGATDPQMEYGFRSALLGSVEWLAGVTALHVVVLKKIVTGELETKKTMGGPVAIVHMGGAQFSEGYAPFLYYIALISFILGFMNLLPIPIVDGGQLVFLTWEAAVGRPVPLAVRNALTIIMFGLFIFLFLYVTYNDISRISSN